MSHYGIDLRMALWGDGWRSSGNPEGKLGVRRLRSYIDGLPIDGAFIRAKNPDVAMWLNSTPDLVAVLGELVDQGNRQYLLGNGVKSTELPAPFKVRRPGDEPEAEDEMKTGEDLMAFMTANAVRAA